MIGIGRSCKLLYNLKRRLVGTCIGRILANARDNIELVRTPKVAWGTAINDQLAYRIMTRLVEPGKAFVDVGAHIGSASAEVMHNCQSCRIIMVEPIPQKAKWLKRRFPNAEIYCTALADYDGEASFYIDRRQSGYSSLSNHREDLQEIVVPITRLDSMLDRDDIDVMKVDVEGAELGVLRGCEGILARCRPLIVFESGPQDHLGYTKDDMFNFLDSKNYKLFAPNRLGHTGEAMDLQGYLDSHEYPRRTTNYFALPDERISYFRYKAKCLRYWA